MNDKCSNYLGFLLNKVLILPILKQGRNYPDDTWVFMLVAVCQLGGLGDHLRLLAKLEQLAFFLI